MDFFVDRNLPEKLARMLGQYDRNHNVFHLDDRFDKTTPDTEWLLGIAEWDPIPIVISGDGRILKNPAELQVLSDLPITFFLFAPAWANMAWPEQAWKTIKVWPEIVKNAQTTKPTIYQVPIGATKVDRIGLTSNLKKGKKR